MYNWSSPRSELPLNEYWTIICSGWTDNPICPYMQPLCLKLCVHVFRWSKLLYWIVLAAITSSQLSSNSKIHKKWSTNHQANLNWKQPNSMDIEVFNSLHIHVDWIYDFPTSWSQHSWSMEASCNPISWELPTLWCRFAAHLSTIVFVIETPQSLPWTRSMQEPRKLSPKHLHRLSFFSKKPAPKPAS